MTEMTRAKDGGTQPAHFALDNFTVTATTTDAEIDAAVAEAAERRVAAFVAKTADRAELWRREWIAELQALRDEATESGEPLEHEEHFTSRLEPVPGTTNAAAWTYFTVTAKTSDTAIALIAEAGVDRRAADDRAHNRHDVARWADAWMAELRQLRDVLDRDRAQT